MSLSVVLFGTWLLWSGHYETLILGFGVGSCLLVVLIAWRMGVVDEEGHPVHLVGKVHSYWIWLAWEIVKSNIDVARRIVHPDLPVSPTMVQVPTSQTSELGRVIYANSITLTPGTVSVEVEGGAILVHALDTSLADALAGGEMDARAAALEDRSRRRAKAVRGEAA